MRRGDIWWATLPPPIGAGSGDRHPVVIVQSDQFTQGRIRTVIVVVLTANLSLAHTKNRALLLPVSQSGLAYESVADFSQILSIDKTLLIEFIKTLPEDLMDQLDEGLRAIFGLY